MKKKRSFLGTGCFLFVCLIGFCFVSSIIMALIMPESVKTTQNSTNRQKTIENAPAEEKTKPVKSLGMGDSFTIDDLQYTVTDAVYSQQIKPGFDLVKPNSIYLLVTVKAGNVGKKSTYIPTPKLFDENGAEYSMSPHSLYAENSMVLQDLNPGVSREGVIAFDVPKGRQYRIALYGPGLFSDKKEVMLGR